MIDHISLCAEPGQTLAVRMSLDGRGFVRNEYPERNFEDFEGAVDFANSFNNEAGHGGFNSDVIKLYDDQGNWVGGWSADAAPESQQQINAA